MRRRVSFVVQLMAAVVVLGALAPAPVAAEPSEELKQAATGHFDRGVELYSEGNLDASLVEFERAYELIPNYRLLYNLGQVQAERHDYAAALELYQRYLDAGGAEVAEDRQSETRAEIEKMRERTAQLWIECNVAGAKLFVDDAGVATLPLKKPLTINAGVRELRLEAAGYLPSSRRLKVAGGEQPRVVLSLASISGGKPSQPVAAGRAAREVLTPNYTALSIAAATTVVLGAATVGFGLAAQGASRDLDSALERFPADPAEVSADRSRIRLYSGLTMGAAAASVVALGFAVYFLVDPPLSAGSERERGGLRVMPTAQGLAVTF